MAAVTCVGPGTWAMAAAAPERESDGGRVEAGAASGRDADELALAAAAGRGDRDAFARLVERYRRDVYLLCYRFAGNHEDASDLAQEVFVRAWRGLPRFRGRSALRTWLYRIGINVCLSRSVRRELPVDPDARLDAMATARADTPEGPAEAVLRRERAALVRSAIRRLPPRQRATLVLRIYHELPHEEIARLLGSSVGACKANLFHALAKLRVWLNDLR
ncbi:MAG TPA: sigma-70 family RNA polymerase sigma factor [Vicinamibacterales bacterium]|nr:sigma-70 family RNA polymerase sigma factor [Vicinamibacterales bacterium]